jgi:hypothetical protein
MVLLQNCVGFVEVETGSCSEAGVKCDVAGTEEVSIKVEEALDIKEEVSIKVEDAVDIKDEMAEAIPFPPIKTEQEVRLWGVCEVVAAHAFRPFIAPKRKLKLHLTVSAFVLFWVPYIFKFWIATLKGRDFLEVIAINGRIILKCIL